MLVPVIATENMRERLLYQDHVVLIEAALRYPLDELEHK